MKVYYMNDEQKPMVVRVQGSNFDPVTGMSDDVYVTLQPAEGRVFDVDVREGFILYVKKWREMVMLSYLDQSVLATFDRPASEPQDGVSST